jgi:hypothetical protein
MPTPYVATPSETCWHILRPNERERVWCRPNLNAWTQIMLNLPASVCPVCLDAETASLATNLNRVPSLSSAF